MNHIRRSRAFGRLTLRNSARIGVAHLYFHYGRLIHMVGNRGDMQATLDDLRNWAEGTARFERSGPINTESLKDVDEQLFDDVLVHLQRRGVIARIEIPRVIEGQVFVNPEAEQLITPFEWRVLIEGTRRISLAVARLVGPREAFTVLKDILDDCTAAFPAFSCLQISPNGYLQLASSSQLDHLPRKEVLAGFAALIATCQYFCSPMIGENEAYKLFADALGELKSTMVGLEVFRLNKRFLLQ